MNGIQYNFFVSLNMGHPSKVTQVTTMTVFLTCPCLHFKVRGELSDKSQRFFANAFQVTQPNQFCKLYVIVKGINKNCKCIKEFSRFIMHLAHPVQSVGSAEKKRLEPVNTTSN